MTKQSHDVERSYDVVLLVSTFGEPVDDTLRFIYTHAKFASDIEYSVIIALVFELSESTKANNIRKEIRNRGLEDRVRILVNAEGQGFASCLNYGISRINARYIMRIDTDDTCCPNRIHKQIDAMDKCGIDLCYGWMVTENGRILRYPSTKLGIWASIGLGQNPIPHPTVCIKREKILRLGMYNESLTRAEDFELWVRALRSHSLRIKCIREPLTLYNVVRARCKDNENAKAQILIRMEFLEFSIGTIPILSGLICNCLRLFDPLGMVLGLRRRL